jgi:hypothetical protein
METLNIKLQDIFILESEINGLSRQNPKTGENIVLLKGLVNEKINLSTKFWLLELNKEIAPLKTSLESLRDELIKKHGTEDKSGQIMIPIYEPGTEVKDENGNIVDGKINSKYEQFQKEYTDLLNEEKEIKYKPIPLSVLESIETEATYFFILQNLVETE